MADLRAVFNTFADDFLAQSKISSEQASVLNLIRKCRTHALGSHANCCDQCGHISIAYDPCQVQTFSQCSDWRNGYFTYMGTNAHFSSPCPFHCAWGRAFFEIEALDFGEQKVLFACKSALHGFQIHFP